MTGAGQQNLNHTDFIPMTGLQNCHLMTILGSVWRRSFPQLLATQEQRIIQVSANSKVMVECNFTPSARRGDAHGRAIAIILHGLEGSSRSHYVMGVAEKFLASGISTVRANLRNCGGTMHLTDTLYNAGLSADIVPIAEHFLNDGFEHVFTIGSSLGGNIVLKGAAELAKTDATWLKGVCAVSPSLDLPTCVDALELWQNRIYELNFLNSLKSKILQKNKLHPGLYDISCLPKVSSVRNFDNTFTAPDGGYKSAADYYARASALPMIPSIRIPILVIAAQDDPLVPFPRSARKNWKVRMSLSLLRCMVVMRRLSGVIVESIPIGRMDLMTILVRILKPLRHRIRWLSLIDFGQKLLV